MGVTITPCVPVDPESKGGLEAMVRIAKANLVPTEFNLRDEYYSSAELVEGCEEFMTKVNFETQTRESIYLQASLSRPGVICGVSQAACIGTC